MTAVALPGTGSWSWLTTWSVAPWNVLPIALVAALYWSGARRLGRRGSPWPSRRSAWFAGGIAVLALALVSPVDAYAHVLYAVHMFQHLLLILVAPPLLALGAPITLALRASSPKTRTRVLLPILHSRPASVLARPLVGWLLFVGVPFAIHFTPLFDLALRHTVIHALEHLLWLGTALVYWWPIVGRDPLPRPVGYPARLLSLLLAMPAGSFVAVSIYSARVSLAATYAALPPPWGTHALADQRTAAVVMWLFGNLALVLAILLVAVAWKHDEERRQHRIEASGMISG